MFILSLHPALSLLRHARLAAAAFACGRYSPARAAGNSTPPPPQNLNHIRGAK